MVTKVSYATDQGKKRIENQDVVLCEEPLSFYAVSDGMGGLLFGKQSAEMVSSLLRMFVQGANLPGMSIEEAEQQIRTMIVDVSGMLRDMGNTESSRAYYGATLTGFYLHGNQAIVFNVGDSRVYILRQESDLTQITRDDDLYELVAGASDTILTEAEAAALQNQLTQFMGMYQGITPATQIIDIFKGDMLLACSDGLTKMLSDEEIQSILKKDISPEEKVQQLVADANAAGGRDNISVILLEVGE